jgi:hypothetical protein
MTDIGAKGVENQGNPQGLDPPKERGYVYHDISLGFSLVYAPVSRKSETFGAIFLNSERL